MILMSYPMGTDDLYLIWEIICYEHEGGRYSLIWLNAMRPCDIYVPANGAVSSVDPREQNLIKMEIFYLQNACENVILFIPWYLREINSHWATCEYWKADNVTYFSNNESAFCALAH